MNDRRHVPVPPAPVVGAALSGFVVGVVLTLIMTGALIPSHRATAQPRATLPPPTSTLPTDTLRNAVRRIVVAKLGGELPNPHVPRLMYLGVYNDPLATERFTHTPYYSVRIVFRLYNHPFGPSWRVRAAKADVFAVMKALYTSGLPIYDVEMQGWFSVNVGKTVKFQPVLEAYMTYTVASTIPWKHWGRDQESQLWNLLPVKSIDARFGQ